MNASLFGRFIKPLEPCELRLSAPCLFGFDARTILIDVFFGLALLVIGPRLSKRPFFF